MKFREQQRQDEENPLEDSDSTNSSETYQERKKRLKQEKERIIASLPGGQIPQSLPTQGLNAIGIVYLLTQSLLEMSLRSQTHLSLSLSPLVEGGTVAGPNPQVSLRRQLLGKLKKNDRRLLSLAKRLRSFYAGMGLKPPYAGSKEVEALLSKVRGELDIG